MKGKELTVEQVTSLPHGTRIVVESDISKQDHALINQEESKIGNWGNMGISNCIWNFKGLKENAQCYHIKFYEWADENQKKNPITLEDGYEFQVGDIVTGLLNSQWLKNYNAEILKIHSSGKVDLKVFKDNGCEDKIYNDMWKLDELKLVKSKEVPQKIKEKPTNTFTKSMLKTGHLVQTRNGTWWFVFRDLSNECFTDGLVYIKSSAHYTSREFMNLDKYTEDLKRNRPISDDYDIIKVATCKYSTSFLAKRDVDLLTDFEIIWEIKEINNTCEKNGIFRYTIDGNTYAFEFKDNKISTIDGLHKGEAKCHPEDEFNKDRGCRLALARAKEKEVKANLNKLHKEIENLTK